MSWKKQMMQLFGSKRKGIGLKNMRSRAESNGARIKISSAPKKGTEIRLIITTKTLYHEPES